jgi:hypothetical protein
VNDPSRAGSVTWTAHDTPPQAGKLAVITSAGGLGFEAALERFDGLSAYNCSSSRDCNQPRLRELSVHFEASASEATAAAMLAASINYPRDWLERLLTYIGGRRRPQFGGAFNGGINEFPKFYSSINQLVATEMWYTGHRSRGQGVLVRKSGCACTCE